MALADSLRRTALAEPKTAVLLVIFSLILASALARLIGFVALLAAIGSYTKPQPPPYHYFSFT